MPWVAPSTVAWRAMAGIPPGCGGICDGRPVVARAGPRDHRRMAANLRVRGASRKNARGRRRHGLPPTHLAPAAHFSVLRTARARNRELAPCAAATPRSANGWTTCLVSDSGRLARSAQSPAKRLKSSPTIRVGFGRFPPQVPARRVDVMFRRPPTARWRRLKEPFALPGKPDEPRTSVDRTAQGYARPQQTSGGLVPETARSLALYRGSLTPVLGDHLDHAHQVLVHLG